MPKKERKKKQYPDDDGRTIANMNIDGMPWYTEDRDRSTPSHKAKNEAEAGTGESGRPEGKITLSGKEGRAMMRGVLFAALLVGAVFFGVLALFILFCVYVWFR